MQDVEDFSKILAKPILLVLYLGIYLFQYSSVILFSCRCLRRGSGKLKTNGIELERESAEFTFESLLLGLVVSWCEV